MHTTVETILECAEHAGISATEEQQHAFVKQLEAALGGAAVYFPKRAARPAGGIVTSARMITGGRSSAFVRDVQKQYGVCRATAYNWIRRSKK